MRCWLPGLLMFIVVTLPYTSNAFKPVTLWVQHKNVPVFPGGDAEWRKYLERNINRDIRDEKLSPGCYTIRCSFKVDVDGAISDIQVIRNSYPNMTAELVRVLKASPKWLPGVNGGKAVATRKEIAWQFWVETESLYSTE